jgi:hypothetical protein
VRSSTVKIQEAVAARLQRLAYLESVGPSGRLLGGVWKNGDFGGKLAIARMGINDHRGPLDQIKQRTGLAICAHNRRLRGYLEGLSRLFGIAGYRQIAVARIKVGDIAGERSRKNPEDESEKNIRAGEERE